MREPRLIVNLDMNGLSIVGDASDNLRCEFRLSPTLIQTERFRGHRDITVRVYFCASRRQMCCYVVYVPTYSGIKLLE